MDLASYADLAIELVNTRDSAGDALQDLTGLQTLLRDKPHMGGRIGHRDLDVMRSLRAELHAVFVAAAAGREQEAMDRLNSLLIQHPVHPQISDHDGEWHLHLNEGGSIPDRFAARAAMGLAVKISDHGLQRLGVCRADGCERVFFDATSTRTRRHCAVHWTGRPGVAAARRTSDQVTAEVQSPAGNTRGDGQ
ncbi:hypothetical protein GCM10009678_15710 [Actinomadura kijaniata]|uniref:Putative RNA-binding Zn ribbon-like protein n=1 Tax=Actinomadura namibiensis TaxID=182080 RepID=A0A7W3LIW2_ACTNM|nr:ABATE domain-containing protein [Actinomadura namibiensis]MBA8948951.1 putative RNA-binding Zn ribbon-like protein [Actinomadura namibiensis]